MDETLPAVMGLLCRRLDKEKALYLIRLYRHGLPCDRVKASAATLCTDSALWQHHNQPGVRGPHQHKPTTVKTYSIHNNTCNITISSLCVLC